MFNNNIVSVYSEPKVDNVNGDGSDKDDDSDGPPPLMNVDPEAEGERLKEQGNNAFKSKRYGEAVDLYTKAISESIYLVDLIVVVGDPGSELRGFTNATRRVRVVAMRRRTC